MNLVQGHDTPLGHGQHLCEILFRRNIEMIGRGFWVCDTSDLDRGYMTFIHDYDTSLNHGQQFCEIIPRSNIAVMS